MRGAEARWEGTLHAAQGLVLNMAGDHLCY